MSHAHPGSLTILSRTGCMAVVAVSDHVPNARPFLVLLFWQGMVKFFLTAAWAILGVDRSLNLCTYDSALHNPHATPKHPNQ